MIYYSSSIRMQMINSRYPNDFYQIKPEIIEIPTGNTASRMDQFEAV